MYLIYSLLTLAVFIVVSPYFLFQARPSQEATSAACGSAAGHLPVSLNVDGEESIWIHAVSVGEALTARALAADLEDALSRASGCSCRPRRLPGSRSPAAACSTSTRCSISRSTGRSSSAAR